MNPVSDLNLLHLLSLSLRYEGSRPPYTLGPFGHRRSREDRLRGSPGRYLLMSVSPVESASLPLVPPPLPRRHVIEWVDFPSTLSLLLDTSNFCRPVSATFELLCLTLLRKSLGFGNLRGSHADGDCLSALYCLRLRPTCRGACCREV